jgi:S1-C subfamily serine protease
MTTSRKLARFAIRVGLAGAVVAVCLPAQLGGQDAGGSCGATRRPIGTLGIASLSCGPCSSKSEDGRTIWRFDAEPLINAIQTGGPTDGKLESGDRIIAVDGELITTARGGRRWSTIAPGESVTLLVRRDGREREVQVTAGRACAPVHTEEGATDLVFFRRHAASGQQTTIMPLSGQAWFGLVLECDDCTAGNGWTFRTPPAILATTDGGPAAEAGLRVGDTLMAIDRLAFTSPEGVRRLSMVRSGESVRLTVRRGGRTLTLPIAPTDGRAATPERSLSRDELVRRLEHVRELPDLQAVRSELEQLLRRLRDSVPPAQR